ATSARAAPRSTRRSRSSTVSCRFRAGEDHSGGRSPMMSRVIDWWEDLLPAMKEAIEQFRTELGAAIGAVGFAKKALGTQTPETGERGRPCLKLIPSSAARCRQRRWPIRPWVRRSTGDKHELGQHLTPR